MAEAIFGSCNYSILQKISEYSGAYGHHYFEWLLSYKFSDSILEIHAASVLHHWNTADPDVKDKSVFTFSGE
jgi:hypothetical protein